MANDRPTEPMIENLRKLFNECDKDNNGCLNRSEFFELCNKIGFNQQAAHETFERLDTDKNGWITFAEFSAGFQQCASGAAPSGGACGRPRALPRRGASPLGVMSLGNEPLASKSNSRGSEFSPIETNDIKAMSHELHGDFLGVPTQHEQEIYTHNDSHSHHNSNYDTHTNTYGNSNSCDQLDVASGSNPYLSQAFEHERTSTNSPTTNYTNTYSSLGAGGQPSSLGGHIQPEARLHEHQHGSGGSFGHLSSSLRASQGERPQFKSMQDLLQCVEKLQSENQILSQIFFKDKREREHYISQLGEEFDQQVREVEESATRKARSELESEKRKLRELMQAERETLQNHFETIERMSDLVRSSNLDANHSSDQNQANSTLDSIDDVKSKLEDTYMENKQLRKSLLDTKTDVAMIWKEMEKLKRQYEEKLSSAYETNQQTKEECDHIKQQLALMKDSNRRLQDASDVITQYIEDKVEPVIKIATNCDQFADGAEGLQLSLGSQRLVSRSSSRRGSILSEYLNNNAEHDATPTRLETSHSNIEHQKPSSSSKSDATSRATRSLQNDGSEKSSAVEQKAVESLNTKSKTGLRLKNIGKLLFQSSSRSDSIEPTSTSATTITAAKLAETQADLKQTHKAHQSHHVEQQPTVEWRLEPADSGPIAASYDIILIGDSFVGKSSLATRITEGHYVRGIISTTSIDFKQKRCKLDGLNYEINIWDTAGQERFRSITASYFRKAKGIILMYDVTEKHTYLNVRNWMNTIANNAPETVAVLLLANKIDLRTEQNKFSCVQTEDGLRLASEYGIIFLETSVKSGVNLEASIAQLIRLIIENNRTPEEEDTDRIRLDVKNRGYACMPKNC